jgi:hypothetical protein
MLDDARVLETWSSGVGSSSPAEAVLALARPDLDPIDRRDLAADEANRSFVATIRALGEPVLDTLVACSGCGERIEIDVPFDALPEAPADVGPLEVIVGSRRLAYRVPTVGDLDDARRCADAGSAEALLVERCLGRDVDPELAAGAADAIDERHPFLAPRVGARCPACDMTFTAPLDLADLAWAALARTATQLVDDIAHLARAYGWSEAEALAVPRARRELYRQLVDDGLV